MDYPLNNAADITLPIQLLSLNDIVHLAEVIIVLAAVVEEVDLEGLEIPSMNNKTAAIFKNNKIDDMKFLIITFVFILGASTLMSQTDSTKIRIDSVTYMKITGYERIYIENLNPQIKKVEANYDTHEYGYKIKFSNENIIIQLIKKYLTPFFIEHGVPADVPSALNNVIFTLHADMEGKIIAVDFLFSEKSDIPIPLLHKFSQEIQRSNLRLIYNKNDLTFKNAKRLLRLYAMSSIDIKDLK
ncbi:hypothetical protein [Butyricimonas paravirosa]